MAIPEVLVDAETRDRLGEDGLTEIVGHLWAVDCQTCGKPLGDQPPSVWVDDMMVFATASVHHEACRQPGWNDSGRIGHTRAPLLSWHSRTFVVPFMKGAKEDPRPMLLVNPALEQVSFARNEKGQWQVDLARYAHDGLVTLGEDFNPDRPIHGAVATLGANEIAVTLQSGVETYSANLAPQAVSLVRKLGGVLFAVTYAFNPNHINTPQELDALFRSGRLRLGWVGFAAAQRAAADKVSRTAATRSPATTWALHWRGDHATIGKLLATTDASLTEVQAEQWATDLLGKKASLIGWEPITSQGSDDGRYTLDSISAAQYTVRRYPDGWKLTEVLSRSDGRAFDTEVEVKHWAGRVLEARQQLRGLQWKAGEGGGAGKDFYATTGDAS